jgi:hypothetical protein
MDGREIPMLLLFVAFNIMERAGSPILPGVKLDKNWPAAYILDNFQKGSFILTFSSKRCHLLTLRTKLAQNIRNPSVIHVIFIC